MPIEHERFPERLRPAARRMRAFLRTDSTALLILGVGILVRGYSYSMIAGAALTHPAERLLPMNGWAIIWMATGLVCLLSAFIRMPLVVAVALGTGVGLNALWGMSFLVASWLGEQGRGYVGAIGYFSIVALVIWAVWRGKAGTVQVKSRKEEHV